MSSFPSDRLLQWFSKNQRDLPWRTNYDPYHVWVSEVMAQQTRIDQMLPFYKNFLKQFPSVHALADADEQVVLKSWEGLGYYSRARNLQKAAKQVKEKYNGTIPQKKEELKKLSGFGDYISSAVASIAFNENVPVVDGNVLRVASRFWGLKEDVSKPKTKNLVETKLVEVFPEGKARNFNQALMELGALVCVPDNPSCEVCPLKNSCFAFLNNQQSFFPVKTKRDKIPLKHFALAVIEKNGMFLLKKRSEKLLNGFFEFPMVGFDPLLEGNQNLERKFGGLLGFPVKIEKNDGFVSHQYSHFKQIATIFSVSPVEENVKGTFYSMKQMDSLPIPMVQKKVLKKILVNPKRENLN